MTRFKYYSNYLACLLGTLIAFELCWIGAKYVIEGEVVHTCFDADPDMMAEFCEALLDPQIVKTAFNANFERTCLAKWLQKPMPPEEWRCTMVKALTLGLPGNLAGAGEALGLPPERLKDPQGKALIQFFSKRVTGGRCSAVCSLNRYHLKPSNRKKEQAKGNEVTSFLYRLLKITSTHMKTGPREDIYAHYRKNSGPRSNRRTLMKRRERDIESGLRRQVEKKGGKFMKFTSPGNDGVPDRIAVLPGGRVWFVELKREGEKPTAIQKWQMEQLRKMGCNVALIAGKQEARAWIQEVIG